MSHRAEHWIRATNSKPRAIGERDGSLRIFSRDTHRVGLSNQRLLAMDERGVTFRTKDGKAITVPGIEMLARNLRPARRRRQLRRMLPRRNNLLIAESCSCAWQASTSVAAPPATSRR